MKASLLTGEELYREVVLDKLRYARESVSIATANVKDKAATFASPSQTGCSTTK